MMNIDITVFIEAIITIVMIVCTRYLIPWLKTHLDSNEMKLLLTFVDIFVESAEQLFEVTQGNLKKQYVLAKLEDEGFAVDESKIDAMIEASVLRLHKELEK